MKTFILTTSLATLGLAIAGVVTAADHEAGVPLTPAEAAGPWTVSSDGHDLCRLMLGADHGVKGASDCRDAIPGAPARWAPTADGMQLMAAGGQPLIAFHRWSNSLFVSHRSSGADIQLRRGA